MATTYNLESAAIENYAVTLARSLLLSNEGNAAGYWEKPFTFIGRPRVIGEAYVLGTYMWFILGCPLAGLRKELTEQLPILSGAESLIAYYLEYPAVKATMDAHWKSANEFAAKTPSPELVDSIGGLRSLLTEPDVCTGRTDEKILTVYWEIMRQGPAFTIQEGINAFVSLFLYGTTLPPSEVKRLWGIQSQAAVVPLMEQLLEDAQAVTVAEINSLRVSH